jgi:hypothetical protein
MPNVPERRVCAVISVPRSAVRATGDARVPVVDEVLALRDTRCHFARMLGSY